MPTIQPGSKVLVTGGNGFIGAWVIHNLLAEGYSVRAVVRSEEKAHALKEHFSSHNHDGHANGSVVQRDLEFAYVPDFLKEGAFDDVIEGVEAVMHLASPITTKNGPADEFIRPALNGTLNLLKAASLPISTVKRFVHTSTVYAITQPLSDIPEPSSPEFTSFSTTVFDEEDWAPDVEVLNEAQRKGEDTSFLVKYTASKILAERAAWDWVKEKQGQVGFDLVVINPPFVLGPALIRSQPTATSVDWWFQVAVKGVFNGSPELIDYRSPFCYVDVRDLAKAQVASLMREEAGNERAIVAAASYTWQEAIDTLNSLSSSLAPLSVPLTKGLPNLHLRPLASNYSNEKGKRLLGVEYRSFEETVKDMIGELSRRGY